MLKLLETVLRNRSRNRNRRNRIILTQEEPEPYPCSRFRFRLRFLLQKKYLTKSTLTGHWPTHAWSWREKKPQSTQPAGVFIGKITYNLRLGTGTGTVTVNKKFGTRNRNRNLGKMARFRNTD
jgi:hypothetical protein